MGMTKQIEEKKYNLELKSLGIKGIVKLGIASKSKNIKIDTQLFDYF